MPIKKLIIIISFIATCAFGQLPTPISSPTISPLNGHDYVLLSQSTWSNAESEAQILGGTLTTVRNQQENDWIYNTFSTFGGQSLNLWTGLTSGTNDGSVLANYFWISGEPLTYQNFPEGQGTTESIYTAGEHYVYIIAPGINESSTWNNYYNATDASYNGGGQTLPDLPICGVVEIVPEPSFISLGFCALTLVVFRRFELRHRRLYLHKI